MVWQPGFSGSGGLCPGGIAHSLNVLPVCRCYWCRTQRRKAGLKFLFSCTLAWLSACVQQLDKLHVRVQFRDIRSKKHCSEWSSKLMRTILSVLWCCNDALESVRDVYSRSRSKREPASLAKTTIISPRGQGQTRELDFWNLLTLYTKNVAFFCVYCFIL